MALCLIERIVQQAAAQFVEEARTYSFISVVVFVSIKRIVKYK